nr:MAG TPA: hypothetical protein [Caudoviricetes sp.]
MKMLKSADYGIVEHTNASFPGINCYIYIRKIRRSNGGTCPP